MPLSWPDKAMSQWPKLLGTWASTTVFFTDGSARLMASPGQRLAMGCRVMSALSLQDFAVRLSGLRLNARY